MADRIGQYLGNYRLMRLLGQGGFAEVYLGEHRHLKSQAAIKVLHASLRGEEAEGFLKEAQTLVRLVHPHIVRVLDYDVAQGTPFLVMDYAPGGTLRGLHPKGSMVPLANVVSYVKQVADALQYAHDARIVHRDIKPENMLLDQHGKVMLSDFGIALMTQTSRSQSIEQVAGTAAYMAPEQFQGKPQRASDQYALGVVVYEWLSGDRPFHGSFTEIASQHMFMPPPSLRAKVPTISPAVEAVVLKALAKDPAARFASVQDFAHALEQASQLQQPFYNRPQYTPQPPPPQHIEPPPVVTPPQRTEPPSPRLPVYAPRPNAQKGEKVLATLPSGEKLTPSRNRPVARTMAVMLIGLLLLAVLGSTVLLYPSITQLITSTTTHPTGSTSIATINAVHGGMWIDDLFGEPNSLIPNGSSETFSDRVDQAIYLPLFYGDSNGMLHAGAAKEVPTVTKGDISSDLKTWTFHLRPNLTWSDGQPLNADDVNFSQKLWNNPQFGAFSTIGLNLITSTYVSADKLTITFHLKQPYSPFVSVWADGLSAPLPMHVFSSIPADQVLKSPDNLNPKVTSGPFMMSESKPGDHYTVVRNPKYYRASEGLPYLDSLVFRIVSDQNTILKDLQAGTIDSAWFLDVTKTAAYQQLTGYKLGFNPKASSFEAMYFNFKNPILGKFREVRQAMAMAIDHQALINTARHGEAVPLCTDHGQSLVPGYQADAPCPQFDPDAANTLLDQNGWTKGSDGVRAKNGMRLEFQYSTTANNPWRADDELIIQQNFKNIGIKLDIQNYPASTFFGTLLNDGVPGKYDIAEYEQTFGYDADDSLLLQCDQIPPNGANYDFYCNKDLDALYSQEQATADPAARQAVFNKIHQIYLTDFPFLTLYSPVDLYISKNGVHNYAPGPMGASETVNIWEWWCDGGKCPHA